jgi:hypothetical protein
VSPLALLPLLLLAASPRELPPRDPGLWLLERGERPPAEAALLESLRIYTRDLDVPISIRRLPARLDTDEAKRGFAQGQCDTTASLVLWWKADDSGLWVLDCGTKRGTLLSVLPGDELPITVQTLALKVRGLLADSLAQVTAPPRRSTPLPPPPDEAGPRTPPSRAAPEPVPVVASRPEPPPVKVVRLERGVELGAGYVVGTTSGLEGLRQGLSLRLSVVFSSWPAELEFNGIILGRLRRAGPENHVLLREVPFAVSLSPRIEMGKWLLSGGIRVGAHFLTAEGASRDGRVGAFQDVSFALGTTGQLRYAVGRRYDLQLALSDEILLPTRRLTLDQEEVLRIGRWQWNLSLGVVVRL